MTSSHMVFSQGIKSLWDASEPLLIFQYQVANIDTYV